VQRGSPASETTAKQIIDAVSAPLALAPFGTGIYATSWPVP